MVYYGNELYHHGVIGQKWGVRRYQNPDGTWKNAGKAHRKAEEASITIHKKTSEIKKNGLTDEQKATAKKVAVGVGITALTVGAVALYAKNPAVRNVVNSMGSKAISTIGPKIKSGKTHLVNGTKKAIKEAAKGTKNAAIEGAKNAPKKVAKTIVEGAVTSASIKMLDSLIGRGETDRYIASYNSFNKKNKVNMSPFRQDDQNDEDDDD